MYICVCHGVTDLHIDQAVTDGATCMRDLRENLKVATQCGRCASCARDQLHSSLQQCGHRLQASGQQRAVTNLIPTITDSGAPLAHDHRQLAGA